MTFEEFFAKKKIDLTLLKRIKPDLYEEFRQHYALMGEKSFDHTKKYWFNRLRKDFLLPDQKTLKGKADAPGGASSEAGPSTEARGVKPSDVGARPLGFKPRFKAQVTPPTPAPASETPPVEPPAQESVPAKPLGFKPRFKPGITPPTTRNAPTGAQDPTEEPKPPTQDAPEEKPSVAEKPGSAPSSSSPEDGPSSGSAKPLGFKPRFRKGKSEGDK
jgi:hypothetical protein